MCEARFAREGIAKPGRSHQRQHPGRDLASCWPAGIADLKMHQWRRPLAQRSMLDHPDVPAAVQFTVGSPPFHTTSHGVRACLWLKQSVTLRLAGCA
jgi:hypothetical protein